MYACLFCLRAVLLFLCLPARFYLAKEVETSFKGSSKRLLVVLHFYTEANYTNGTSRSSCRWIIRRGVQETRNESEEAKNCFRAGLVGLCESSLETSSLSLWNSRRNNDLLAGSRIVDALAKRARCRAPFRDSEGRSCSRTSFCLEKDRDQKSLEIEVPGQSLSTHW